MKLTPQEILSSEYGENVENRQHGQKYGNYANILEELLLKKVPQTYMIYLTKPYMHTTNIWL